MASRICSFLPPQRLERRVHRTSEQVSSWEAESKPESVSTVTPSPGPANTARNSPGDKRAEPSSK